MTVLGKVVVFVLREVEKSLFYKGSKRSGINLSINLKAFKSIGTPAVQYNTCSAFQEATHFAVAFTTERMLKCILGKN